MVGNIYITLTNDIEINFLDGKTNSFTIRNTLCQFYTFSHSRREEEGVAYCESNKLWMQNGVNLRFITSKQFFGNISPTQREGYIVKKLKLAFQNNPK